MPSGTIVPPCKLERYGRGRGACRRGALYTATIRRGGMGTGLPYWGRILTEEELAAAVDYVWGFSPGIANEFFQDFFLTGARC